MTQPDRSAARAIRRHNAKQDDRFANLPRLQGTPATVTAITPSVTVSWRGTSDCPAIPAFSYTPGVGDRVFCLVYQDQLIIICQTA